MIVPVKCGCGRTVANVYNAMMVERKNLIVAYMKEHGIDINSKEYLRIKNSTMIPSCGEILDKYHFVQSCCRATILSSENFYDLKTGLDTMNEDE